MQRLLDTDLLATFVAIAETGSFTDAAGRVGRTQSAVSMQMRRLEELLGTRLFAKAGRGVALTPPGEQLVAHARRLLRANREVVVAFEEAALEGHLRVGAPDDYAATFLPPVLARFAAACPRVEIELVCEMSGSLVRGRAVGRGDVAILTAGSGEAGGRLLRREPLVWAGAPGHPVHERHPLPLALFHPGCLFRDAALEALGMVGRVSRIAYTSLSVAGIAAAVRAGLAVGVFLRSTVPDGLVLLGAAEGLPPLPEAGIALCRSASAPARLTDALEAEIVQALGGGRRLPAAA